MTDLTEDEINVLTIMAETGDNMLVIGRRKEPTDLTEDEINVLTIMAETGDNMLAIGRWKEPIECLAGRGLCRSFAPLNYVITAEGRTAITSAELKRTDAVLRISNDIKKVRQQALNCMEEAAKQLAEASQAQQALTGTPANRVTWELGQDIIKRALELLK